MLGKRHPGQTFLGWGLWRYLEWPCKEDLTDDASDVELPMPASEGPWHRGRVSGPGKCSSKRATH